MPIIIVYGIPSSKKESYDLEHFCNALIQRTCSIKELNLTKEQVSCFFPADLMNNGLGEEIIMFVEGLFEKPERTEEVRKVLSDKLAECGRKFFPDADLIECLIHPFNPKSGFASISKPKK